MKCHHPMIALNCSRNLSFGWLACCLRLPLALPLLTAVLVLATPPAVQAQLSYTVTNQMVTITGYTGTTDVVAIPSTKDGRPVISIGDYAFYYSSITGVTIPNSVTSIGAHAFDLCDNLTSVMISDSVTNIGGGAFAGCFNLTNIVVDPLNS